MMTANGDERFYTQFTEDSVRNEDRIGGWWEGSGGEGLGTEGRRGTRNGGGRGEAELD